MEKDIRFNLGDMLLNISDKMFDMVSKTAIL